MEAPVSAEGDPVPAEGNESERALRSKERAIVYLMAGVQFVNVLDFMMVNPLGPQFAESLSIPTSELPIVVGSYTAAASVTGVLGSLFLERFDRRSALVVTLIGLAIGTALGGLAVGSTSLLVSRVVAGFFGGPATSLAFAIVSDAIPASRRGWAIGIVMGGFAVASVLGVPAGLLLANLGGWRLPFFGVGALILVAAFFAMRLLPPLRAHLTTVGGEQSPVQALLAIVRRPIVTMSLTMSGVALMAVFVLIPNLPAFTQFNLGFPGERLALIYLIGGVVSLLTTRVVGPLVDRLGSTQVLTAATAALLGITWVGFVAAPKALPVLVLTTTFFIAMSARGVAYNTLTSKVPEPHERARFQSVQSAVGHAATAFASFLSARLMSEGPDHSLVHVERVAYTSIGLGLFVPFLMYAVEKQVRARDAAAGA